MTTLQRIFITFVLSLTVFTPIPKAAARVSADRPAAIVTFPLVRADSQRGEDTTIQLSNADAAAPADISCFLQQLVGRCSQNPQQSCQSSTDCPVDDLCADVESVATPFTLRLTPSQPLRWQLSAGRPDLPLPENLGAIPAAPSDPFIGMLRCLVVDDNGNPAERNVLQGTATLGRYEAGANRIDSAQYNGVGNAALPGANDGDDALVLGGPDAEYEGCPSVTTINHFFDHALEPSTRDSQLFTSLTIVPCAADLFGRAQPSRVVVQVLITNEFEQRFSTSRDFGLQPSLQLSLIDTNQPERSIFSAGLVGTLVGQTRIRGGLGDFGIVGIAVQAHQSLTDPTRIATSAFNLHSDGERDEGDVVALGPCAGGPLPNCRAAQRTSLELSRGNSELRDAAAYTWRDGAATTPADFGNPTSTSEYALCVYEGPAADVVTELHVPPSSASWRAVRRGFRYNDSAGTADGVRRMLLQRSFAQRAHVTLKARGAALPSLDMDAPLQTPVVVQLRHSDSTTCFESSFDDADILRNVSGTFEARQ